MGSSFVLRQGGAYTARVFARRLHKLFNLFLTEHQEGMCHYLHPINDKTHIEKINDSPKVSKPVSGRARLNLKAV